MAKKDPYNKTTSFKVNNEQLKYIKELKADGISLRDVLNYYRIHNTNEIERLRNREKYLLFHIKDLEETLEKERKELKDVRNKLGKAPTEDQARIDVIEARDKIINNCKIKNNGTIDSLTLENYMTTKEAERVLEAVMLRYNTQDKEEFKKEVYKQLKL